MDYQAKIAEVVDFTPSGFIGYSVDEIATMELFYDIKIIGGLRDFFLQMGRSSGNVNFTCMVIPYLGYYAEKTAGNVSGHFEEQLYLRSELEEFARPFHTGNPFKFSIESETQNCFLRTCANEPLVGLLPGDDCTGLVSDPERIYYFDENNDKVRVTDLTFSEYLLSIVEKNPDSGVGRGEMIAFSNYELPEIS